MARSGDLGWARSWISVRRKVLETSKKGKSRKEWLKTEDERKSSYEKLRVVLVAFLVVAVCQNIYLRINIQAKIQKYVKTHI